MLSASTRKVDLHEERPIYARKGVPYLWLVDPVDHTLEAFELHDAQWLLSASAKDDEPVSIRPFDATTFRLGDLWAGDADVKRPACPSSLAHHGLGFGHHLDQVRRHRSPARITEQDTPERGPNPPSGRIPFVDAAGAQAFRAVIANEVRCSNSVGTVC